MSDLLARFATLTANEPPVREDGRCVVCLKPRRPERSAKYAQGCAALDAFCSTECAREFHHNPIPVRESERPNFTHGTTYAYRWRGCRCEDCRRASANQKRRQRARKEAA